MIGAYGNDDAGSSSGSAYVFTRTNRIWSQQTKLVASDAAIDDELGRAVFLYGDTALVGAPLDDDLGTDSGSAYVFERTGTTWTQPKKLTAADGAADDRFGWSVVLQDGTALVGAPLDDDLGTDSGSAYVFERAGSSWGQQAKLTAGDGAADDEFGYSVSLGGDTALVGAVYDDDVQPTCGSAYVFERSGTLWSQQAKLVASDADSDDNFGISVAIDGDIALIGAEYDDSPDWDAGSAYVFERTGTVWVEQPKILTADLEAHDHLGRAVALSGETALIGAPWDDDMGSRSGSAYVFVLYPMATATFRNAGGNPASYVAATLPVLGTTYSSTIDLGGTTGHNLALLVGYLSPLTFPLSGGQVLLVNVLDPSGELLLQSAAGGPIATYDMPVPVDPSFAGIFAATQAVHFGGIQPFALSNAQDLLLGY